ncbi:MAG: hypothetical protein Q6363_006315 [Candidatus Njordarchaeota archaeon]
MSVKRKFKWIFGTEKINIVAFRALEMAIIQDMLNRGKTPVEIRSFMESLGRYFGDLLYIHYHISGGDVARDVLDIGKIANSFYVFLFGERIDKIYFELNGNSKSILLHLISYDGMPTCRGAVSPHPEIKLGSFIIGGINRILEIKKSELEFIAARCWEQKCVSVGDDICEVIIQFEIREDVFNALKEKYGGIINVK